MLRIAGKISCLYNETLFSSTYKIHHPHTLQNILKITSKESSQKQIFWVVPSAGLETEGLVMSVMVSV
jgi:hypothetical protein